MRRKIQPHFIIAQMGRGERAGRGLREAAGCAALEGIPFSFPGWASSRRGEGAFGFRIGGGEDDAF